MPFKRVIGLALVFIVPRFKEKTNAQCCEVSRNGGELVEIRISRFKRNRAEIAKGGMAVLKAGFDVTQDNSVCAILSVKHLCASFLRDNKWTTA